MNTALYIIWILSPLMYALYLTFTQVFMLVSCSAESVNKFNPEVVLYFIGLLFQFVVCLISIGTYYIKKNNIAIYASVLVNISCLVFRGLITFLAYYGDCNVIYIMITFSILGDLVSIILYINTVIAILRKD